MPLSDDAKTFLKQQLIEDEGLRLFPYKDSVYQKLSIGIGRNLDDRGISNQEAQILFQNDIEYFSEKCEQLFPFWQQLSDNRKCVLINMCFELGIRGIQKFEKMIDALNQRNYRTAASEMLNSLYAKQVPNRARRLAEIMKTDILSA